MSRKHGREWKRRKNDAKFRDIVEAARTNSEAFHALLQGLAHSDDKQVWDVARVVRDKHDEVIDFDPDELAMIAEAVNARLAGGTAGLVERRRNTLR